MDDATGGPRWSGRATVAGQVADALADRIIRGEVPVGTVLTEVQIAADAGVSRTPVREAMLALERWGLVQLMPKKGAVVTATPAGEVRDLLRLREMFEVSALQAVLPHPVRRRELFGQLARSLDEQRRALDAGDPSRFSSCDVDFHLRIIRANDNRVIDEVMAGLAPRFARLIHGVMQTTDCRADVLHADHREISDHIGRGDLPAAERLLRAHIQRGMPAPGAGHPAGAIG